MGAAPNEWGKFWSYWLKEDSRNSFVRAGSVAEHGADRQFSAGFSLKFGLQERPQDRNSC